MDPVDHLGQVGGEGGLAAARQGDDVRLLPVARAQVLEHPFGRDVDLALQGRHLDLAKLTVDAAEGADARGVEQVDPEAHADAPRAHRTVDGRDVRGGSVDGGGRCGHGILTVKGA
ncbi:hypothetical protein D3C86_1622340 [compost metagenome]